MTQTHGSIDASTLSLHMADKGAAISLPVTTERPTEKFFSTPWEELPPIPEPVYLIDGVLPAGALTTLYAPSGLGKTELALQLALAVANHGDFHGRATTQGNVLYVDYEMGEQNLRRYGNRLGLRGPIRAVHDVPLPELMPLLERAIADNCKLMIIDSYASMANQTGQDNAVNSNHVAERILKPLADLSHSKGVATLVLHHTNKGSVQYDGSQRIKGLSDMLLKLEFRRRTKTMELSAEKSRYSYKPVEWDASGHPLLKNAHGEDAAGTDLDAQRLEWLVAQLQDKPRPLADLGPGFEEHFDAGAKTLERVASRAVTEGAITKEKVGRSHIYSVQPQSAITA